MKLYRRDFTYTMVGRIRNLVRPELGSGVHARELTVAELIELSKKPEYDMSAAAIDGVSSNSNRHCFGTFNNGVVSAYMFFATGLIRPDMNTAGTGFGGIGMRLPNDVLYIHKGFALPEYRGKRQVNICTIAGADNLVSQEGWMVSTVEIDNHASIKMLENVGLNKQDQFREYRIFGLGKYKVPDSIQLGQKGAESSKSIEIITSDKAK